MGMHVIASSHVDMAWKKNREEMKDLFESMIVRVLDMMDQAPDFTFVVEQAAHFRQLAETRPDLVNRVGQYVREGRIEVVGGMATTLETNIPCGESFIRNMNLGMKWFQANMGVKVKTGWLIDTFGVNAQVPQLLCQAGVMQLMANRFGGEKTEDIFFAVGLDGSQVLVAGRDVFSPIFKNKHVFFQFTQDWHAVDRLFEEASRANQDSPLLVMPYVENEILPNGRMIQAARQRMDSGLDCFFSLPHKFFESIRKMDHPREFADLNPEFTGTYSQRMEIRMKNRKAEEWLLDAEKWSGLLGRQDLNASLEESWWTLSFNQFHDVFTGSHPTEVYHSVLDNFTAVEKTAKDVLEKVFGAKLAVRAETGEFTVISGLPYRRKAIASIPVMKGSGFSVIHDGVEIPSEISEGTLRFLVDMPAMDSATVSLCPDGSSEIQWYEAERVDIENEHLSIGASAARGIEHVTLKKTCNSPETGTREAGSVVLVKDAGSLLVLQKDDGNFQFELPAGSEIPAMAGGAKLLICPATALGQRFRLQGDYRDNQGDTLFGWETEVFLPWHGQRADVRFQIDWKANGYRLRVKLPTVADGSGGIFEIPFGVVRRKPYMPGYNKKGEWPARRFVAVQDGSHGVALINDGVPGVEASGGTLWSTLLRAPAAEYAGMSPDDTSSQHGSHCFHFVLAPYAGDWMQSDITKKADALNSPPRVFSGTALHPGSQGSLDGATAVLSSIKPPMDGTAGEIVARIYETAGNACTAHLEVNGCTEAWHSDITETKGKELECKDGSIELHLLPFEIRTVRITMKNG